MSRTITPDDLRAVPVFSRLSEDDLNWLSERMFELRREAGEVVFALGEEARLMIVVLDGIIQIMLPSGGIRRHFDTLRAGRVTGSLPFSRMTHYGGQGTVVEKARLACLDKKHFPDMLYRMPDVGQELVGMMSDRVRMATRGDQQREKMMALGKLSAGLAHELNNPAAAVHRLSAALRDRLRDLNTLSGHLATMDLRPECWHAAQTVREKALARADEPGLGAVQRSEREDAISDWLEGRGVDDAWSYSEALVEAGLSPDHLEEVAAGLPAEAVGGVIAWVAAGLDADRLLQEIEAASERISSLVASVKQYSHMDRAPDRQPTDVREGIESTLTMLGHRLKEKSIEVEKAFAPDLPSIEAFPGELNQVWTNLIDNAIDALDEGGRLRINARPEGGMVAVDITDNGPGIPPEVRSRIFEPFFSTKDVGKGTGLGLEIVERIVRQHGGDVRVDSVPGETSFRVLLPRS
jgi:signal transduction histidine kinase